MGRRYCSSDTAAEPVSLGGADMKKICPILFALLLLLSLSLPVYAAEELPDYVVDNAGLLTAEEEEKLRQWIVEYNADLQLDIVIVTTYGTDGKGIQAYADDFYDRNGYGYGTDNTGILLLIDMESREWYISTCGEAIYIFTDYGLDQLGQTILPWLSEGAYYRAFQAWISALSPYVKAYHAGSPVDGYVPPDEYESPYGEEVVYYDQFTIENPFPLALLIGFIASAVTVLIMRSRMNTAKLQKGAVDYLKNDSFRMRQRSDMFLYSRVSRRARPKQNSGGGSSVHRSSGGRSHGGRGGRF
jgi:uncharacterized protein